MLTLTQRKMEQELAANSSEVVNSEQELSANNSE